MKNWWRDRDAGMDPQAAFRAGVLGWRYERARDANGTGIGSVYAFGPNERQVVEIRRLPGLTIAQEAFRTGRAIRAIGKLLDRAGAPAAVGRQFLDNLTAAIVTHHMRRTGISWNEGETVGMFMELYERVLGGGTDDAVIIRERLLIYARNDEEPLPGSQRRL